MFTEEDLEIIKQVIKEGGDIWEKESLKPIKDKLKEAFRKKNNLCCYCRRPFTGEFKMVIDIEHILPKSIFPKLMFAPFNLTLACKRCNMNVKREKTDFLNNLAQAHATPKDIALYKFCHPNYEIYSDHLHYLSYTENDTILIKYTVVNDSTKGKYAYDYFKLIEFEVNTLNIAQGVKEKEELSEEIPDDIVKQLENILDNI